MKKWWRAFVGRYLDSGLDFRAQIFNTLGFCGMASGVVMAISNLVSGAGVANVAINLGAAAAAFILIYYANRSGRFERCYLFTVLVVFFIAFPMFFFTAGGYQSGMVAFFVFAIAFTSLMLRGKMRLVVTGLELGWYLAICLIAYYRPETVTPFATPQGQAVDTITGCIVACAVLWFTLQQHLRVYEKKQAELQQANEALQQLDKMKTEFWGNVSHELKTPLTVISNHAQTLRDDYITLPQAGQVAASAALIAAEADRLALMVSQVLDMTRMEEGYMQWNMQPCHIDEIIHGTVQTHFPLLNKTNNRLEIHIESALPMVLADSARIAQVVVNLLTNAIRHTQQGRIIISAKADGNFVAVTVTDNGEGIVAQSQPHVFERYYTGTAQKGAGAGLGLYICKQFIDAHGGKITLQSKPGSGTAVVFTLPVVSA